MILLLSALACAPDDVTDKATGDTADTSDSGGNGDTADTGTGGNGGNGGNGGGEQSITGDWISEGDNISPLFAGDPFNFVTITSAFAADGSYVVDVLDDQGQAGRLTGTYTVDTATLPGTIVLQQATPSTVTAEGIWQVDGSTLTYEVVQTQPDYGYSPPTPESGFGTTSGPNLEPGVNVQVYVRQ